MTTTPEPRVAVATMNAGTYEDVTDDRIRGLVDKLSESKDFEFVICTRSDVEDGFAQACLTPEVVGGPRYTVEYRDGGPGGHWQALTDDLPTVAEVLVGWSFGTPGWKNLVPWQKLDLLS